MVTGLIIMLLAGFVYAWSVMAKPIAASRPEWNAAQLSFTFTLSMIFFCIGGLAAGFIGKKINTKIYIICASLLILSGFWLSGSTNQSITCLYLGFGIVAGFGAGLVYNVVMSTLSAWFPDKHGMISGVMMMGFGISSFLIGKVYAAVTPADGGDGWKITFRVMGMVIFIVVFICGCILKRPDADYVPKNGCKKNNFREPALEVGPGKMLKMPVFWLYYSWAVLIGSAGMAIISQARGIASEVGPTISDGNIATVVGILSLFNGIGRVLFGTLYDKKGYKCTMISDMCIYIVTVMVILTALRTGKFWLIVIGFVIGGISKGGLTPLQSALISDFFGRKNYSRNFAVVSTTLIISSVTSTISGRLVDLTGSYFSTVCMGLGFLIVSFVISFAVRRPEYNESK